MPAPEAIQKLVENFSTHIEHYKSSGYNETELRREYLDPFWKALGWDIDNEQGYADAYKDVIHEDAIKVGGCPVGPRGGHRGLVRTSNIGHRTLNIERVTFGVRCWTFNVRRSHGPNTLKQLETQITATDRQIDRLVYQLYELTDEEIALVESSGYSTYFNLLVRGRELGELIPLPLPTFGFTTEYCLRTFRTWRIRTFRSLKKIQGTPP